MSNILTRIILFQCSFQVLYWPTFSISLITWLIVFIPYFTFQSLTFYAYFSVNFFFSIRFLLNMPFLTLLLVLPYLLVHSIVSLLYIQIIPTTVYIPFLLYFAFHLIASLLLVTASYFTFHGFLTLYSGPSLFCMLFPPYFTFYMNFKSSWCKIASVARNWINCIPSLFCTAFLLYNHFLPYCTLYNSITSLLYNRLLTCFTIHSFRT